MLRPAARRHILVTGIVQGVGFRPFVYRQAREHELTGFVQNTSDGVVIEVEGDPARIDSLIRAIHTRPPPLARIAGVRAIETHLQQSDTFAILASTSTSGRSWLPPDVGICEACRDELRDPSNRRFRHPFISCTDCGPRYTIIDALPYDRRSTSLSGFPLCSQCRDEYESPTGRRFHAEPISCFDCGPRVWLIHTADAARHRHDGDAALRAAQQVLRAGGILAVKGIGGFHLICDASSADAVGLLRQRKQRPLKPFAVVVADLDHARRVAHVTARAAQMLTAPDRPVVLLDRRADADVASSVAPNLEQMGIMLPHSPLHDLIVGDWTTGVMAEDDARAAALVMTSGNRSEEPVAMTDAEAWTHLADLSDALVLHDRPILARCDDSVVADLDSRLAVPIRRSRGRSPTPIALPHATRPLLAVGGELKATFCLALDGDAILSPHVGDMENVETLDAFSTAVNHYCRIFGVEPELYVCDAHPGYLSARWADHDAGGPVLRVQHHHAHAASLMAEHGLAIDERLLTFCFDGTGYGTDGAIWGGEVLDAGYADIQRLAHLDYVPLPGGDAGVRHVSRLALSYLHAAHVPWDEMVPAVRACPPATRRLLADQLRAGIAVVPTSSMGRLFDAVSAVAGVCQTSTYEGEAAMVLEAAAARAGGSAGEYRFDWSRAASPLRIDWRPVIRGVASDVVAGVPAAAIAATFHEIVAQLVAELAVHLLGSSQPRRVGLTGGVFQNRRLVTLVLARFAALDIAVLTHQVVPPNDGGLSLGQAAIASARLLCPDRN